MEKANDREEDLSTLAIRGYACAVFRDDAIASLIENGLNAWSGEGAPSSERLMIDRFDCRGLLLRWAELQADVAVLQTNVSDEGITPILQRLLEKERYLDLPRDPPAEQQPQKIEAAAFAPPQQQQAEERENKGDAAESIPENLTFPFIKLPLPSASIALPTSEKQYAIILATAKRVVEAAPQLELMIRVKQGDNASFNFLDPQDSLFPFYQHIKSRARDPTADWPAPIKADAAPSVGRLLLGIDYDSEATDNDDGDQKDDIAPAAPSSDQPHPSSSSIIAAAAAAPAPPAFPPESIKEVIDKLVEYAKRNGRKFVDLLAEKERANAKFAFLHPWSPWHAYFLWVLNAALATSSSTNVAVAPSASTIQPGAFITTAALAASAFVAATAPPPSSSLAAARAPPGTDGQVGPRKEDVPTSSLQQSQTHPPLVSAASSSMNPARQPGVSSSGSAGANRRQSRSQPSSRDSGTERWSHKRRREEPAAPQFEYIREFAVVGAEDEEELQHPQPQRRVEADSMTDNRGGLPSSSSSASTAVIVPTEDDMIDSLEGYSQYDT